LKKNVGEALSEGLADTILQSPPDPVDYLGKWLLNYVKLKREAENEAAEMKKARAEMQKYTIEEEKEAKAKAALEKDKADAKSKVEEYKKFLEETEYTHLVLSRFCQYLASAVAVPNVYVAEKTEIAAGEEKVEALRYIATTPNQKFLFRKMLKKGEGSTFKVFEKKEEEEEPPAEEEGTPLPPKEPLIHCIQNVLLGPEAKRTTFFTTPQTGAYLCGNLQYKAFTSLANFDAALLAIEEIKKAAEEKTKEVEAKKKENEEKQSKIEEELKAIAEAEAKPEEEKKEEEKKEEAAADREAKKTELNEQLEALKKEEFEAIPDWKEEVLGKVEATPQDLAVCMDTLGSLKQFDEKDIAAIKAEIMRLPAALERSDKVEFIRELERHYTLLEAAASADEKEEAKAREETKKEVEDALEEGATASEQEISFAHAKKKLASAAKNVQEISQYALLRPEYIKVLQAFAYINGLATEDISFPDGTPSPAALKGLFTEEFVQAASRVDLKKTEVPLLSASESLIAEMKEEEVKAKDPIIAQLLGYTKDAIAFRKFVEEEEAKKKAEEEAKKKEEEAKSS